MGNFSNSVEARVAVLVDCDNVSPDILEYALQVAARFGRVVLRRGYGNSATLTQRWQDALVSLAFTPSLQYQFASGKNTSDIALALDALEALFDQRANTFCIVTSDSDFAHLCRKLRERGANVSIVGESKSPEALRNASDEFFEWARTPAATTPTAAAKSAATHASPSNAQSLALVDAKPTLAIKESAKPAKASAKTKSPDPGVTGAEQTKPDPTKPIPKSRPKFIVEAVTLLAGDSPEGKVDLGTLGQYLRRMRPDFSSKSYGHSGLLTMIETYDLLTAKQESGGHWTVSLKSKA